MTITYSRYTEPQSAFGENHIIRPAKPPPRIWHAIDPPFKGYQAAPSDGYQQSDGDTAIVIDNGKALSSRLDLKRTPLRLNNE